jgi:transcriptional regulator with XRE-family HTH domain
MKADMTIAELARQLGVSRTYITLLCNGRRKPSQQIVNKLNQMMFTPEGTGQLLHTLVGKGGFEPPRLSAHDPKSCSSASSDTPPMKLR